jgi:MraZ protein
MAGLLGEYECRLDRKGRFALPAGLKKQIPEEAQGQFVINRGIERCLVLYPANEWNKITAEIEKLNEYDRDNRRFMRYFFRGATALTLDNSDRLLIPQQLQKHAGIERDLILFAYTNKVELWDQATYEQLMEDEPEVFALLAERIMGSLNTDERNTGE